jgi:hypothetical protein
MIIKSSNGNGALGLSGQEGLRQTDGSEYFIVTIKAHNLTASAQVYSWNPFDSGLTNFFDDLAANWKGWRGEKKWSSLEGELTLVGTADSLGHIEIEVSLYDAWTVKHVLHVDGGQLVGIALHARRFFTP